MAQYKTRTGAYSGRNDDVFDVVMIADKDGNVINSSGVASNINITFLFQLKFQRNQILTLERTLDQIMLE